MHIQPWLNEFNRRTAVLFRLWALLERIYIRTLDFQIRPPVFIYQMGKVGSTSVYKTLKQIKSHYSFFHIHWFSKKGIEEVERLFSNVKDPVFFMHLSRCKALKSCFDQSRLDRCKIITMVREPITREISSFFHDMQTFRPPLLKEDAQSLFDFAMTEVQTEIEQKSKNVRFNLTWFDEEFKPALQVDVYDYPFEKNKGYQIIKADRFDILIIQLEQLAERFQEAMELFLGLSVEHNVLKSNTSEKRKYHSLKRKLEANLKLDLNTCVNLYSEKYVRHFYNDTQIEGFIKKWSGVNK